MSDWQEFINDRVLAKSGWYYLNNDIKNSAEDFGVSGGIYIYTDRRRWLEKKYKIGLTRRGEERTFEQGADQDEDMYVIAFISLDITGLGKYDTTIHNILVRDFKCIVMQKESARSPTEWVLFPKNINPVASTLQAIQIERNNVKAGRIDLDLRVPTISMLITWVEDYITRDTLKKIDLYELCARFGKSIFCLSAFAISGRTLMVFGAYYQSAFSSIIDEVSLFNQFAHMRVVDGRESGAKELVEKYINEGFKVVLLAGLHHRDNWEENYMWVNAWDPEDKLCFFDEIDFGVTTDNVSSKVKYLIGDAYAALMSGTNIDKAHKNFGKRIDKNQYYTYEEMLETRAYLKQHQEYAEEKLAELITLVEKV
jgi:hypothetical protein